MFTFWERIKNNNFIIKNFRVLCVLVIAFDILTTVYFSVQMLKSNIREILTTTNNEIALYIDSTLRLGTAIANDEEIKDTTIPLVERAAKLDSYTKAYNLFMVGVLDKDGNIGSSIRHKTGYVGYRPYFKEMLATRKTVLSDQYVAGADHETKIYTLWIPYYDEKHLPEGEIAGAITMSIYFDKIEDIIQNKGDSNTAYECSVVDSRGIISANNKEDMRGMQIEDALARAKWRSMSDELVKEHLKTHKEFSYWAWDRAFEYVSYMPIPQTNWLVSMRIDVFKSYSILLWSLLLKLLVYFSIFLVLSLRKNREIWLHDNLFNMMSINTDDVFGIFDIKKNKPEYISYNIERIMSVDHDEVFNDHSLMKKYFQVDFEVIKAKLFETEDKTYAFEREWKDKSFYFKSYLVEHDGELKIIMIVHDRTEERIKNDRLKTALQQAEKANIAKTVFLSAMSHDIRTPMNAIMGMTAIAKEHLHELPRVADCLDKIDVSSKYLLNLIDEVLDMARIENDKMILQETAADLENIVDEIFSILKVGLYKKDQKLTIDLSGLKHRYVYADKEKLQKVLVNIVSNAIKYTDVKGKIKLKVKELGCDDKGFCSYQFTVTDNGSGISKEFLPKIFLPFEREENSVTNKIQGTGLGLTISKRIANMMQGDITVKSESGQGSVFTVAVKLKLQQENDGSGQESEDAAEALEAPPDYTGKRILVVEDNELNYEIIAEIIGCAGITVEWAENGLLAVEKVRNSAEGYFDLIFMDIQMPVMDGYTASKNIRNLEREDVVKMPIVAVSANAFSEDVHKSFVAGMNEHLAKPIDIQKLYTILKRYLTC